MLVLTAAPESPGPPNVSPYAHPPIHLFLVACQKMQRVNLKAYFFCAGVMRMRVWVRRNGGGAMGEEQSTPKKPEMTIKL